MENHTLNSCTCLRQGQSLCPGSYSHNPACLKSLHPRAGPLAQHYAVRRFSRTCTSCAVLRIVFRLSHCTHYKESTIEPLGARGFSVLKMGLSRTKAEYQNKVQKKTLFHPKPTLHSQTRQEPVVEVFPTELSIAILKLSDVGSVTL